MGAGGGRASEIRFFVIGSDFSMDWTPVGAFNGADAALWCAAILNVFFVMRSAGTTGAGCATDGGRGSDSSRSDGSSVTMGEVGGEGGSSNQGSDSRDGVATTMFVGHRS